MFVCVCMRLTRERARICCAGVWHIGELVMSSRANAYDAAAATAAATQPHDWSYRLWCSGPVCGGSSGGRVGLLVFVVMLGGRWWGVMMPVCRSVVGPLVDAELVGWRRVG